MHTTHTHTHTHTQRARKIFQIGQDFLNILAPGLKPSPLPITNTRGSNVTEVLNPTHSPGWSWEWMETNWKIQGIATGPVQQIRKYDVNLTLEK
jgi:hypothetical protein